MSDPINRPFQHKIRSIVRELEDAAASSNSAKVVELCDDLQNRQTELDAESARISAIVAKYRPLQAPSGPSRKFRHIQKVEDRDLERSISFTD